MLHTLVSSLIVEPETKQAKHTFFLQSWIHDLNYNYKITRFNYFTVITKIMFLFIYLFIFIFYVSMISATHSM